MRERGATSDGEPALPPLSAACQGLALLALEGLALGLAFAEIGLWFRLPAYVVCPAGGPARASSWPPSPPPTRP
jgi:hypothetical protein